MIEIAAVCSAQVPRVIIIIFIYIRVTVRVRVRKLVVDEDNIDGGLSLGLVA